MLTLVKKIAWALVASLGAFALGTVALRRGEPISGPAPAIAAKWWPNSTCRWVGTKSSPSLRVTAGVGRDGSIRSTRSAMKRP